MDPKESENTTVPKANSRNCSGKCAFKSVRPKYIHQPKPEELERPCCYHEYIGPRKCWEDLGIRIRWTVPKVPGTMGIHMYDPLILGVCLECKKPIPIIEASASAWTNMFHAANHEGIYREIEMLYNEDLRKWDDNGVTTYEFLALVFPTHDGVFRLTFNVKYREYMIWAAEFQCDHILRVLESRPNNMWVAIARQSQITSNIFVGNFLSVLVAEEMGFDNVLNLDDLTQEKILRNVKGDFLSTIRMFLETEPGGGHVIPEEKIINIVNWLRQASASGRRVLVGDRTGQGRVGSALTAYVYANNPNLTFEEAYEFVKRKRFVFCHKGLKDTLATLYPRD